MFKLYKPFEFILDMHNVRKEKIDTKFKVIKMLIHTANSEQIYIHSIYIYYMACYQYNIDVNSFYLEKLRDDKELRNYGIKIFYYDDGEISYCTNSINLTYNGGKYNEWGGHYKK